MRVRRVISSGSFTRLPHPTSPARVPTRSTAAETISAAAHSGIAVPSASAPATSIIDTVQMAQSPATPSPFAMATSFLRSALSSALASSTSFFARSTAFCVMCCNSSLLDIDSSRTGTDEGGGSAMRSDVSGSRFRSAISSSWTSSGGSPRRARSSWSSSR